MPETIPMAPLPEIGVVPEHMTAQVIRSNRLRDPDWRVPERGGRGPRTQVWGSSRWRYGGRDQLQQCLGSARLPN